MSTAVAVPAARSRVLDYVELTKPRIAVMALVSVAVGYALAAAPHFDAAVLAHTLFGAGLVAAGASTLNQFLERRRDALMPRTAERPLPAGRLTPAESLAFGLALGLGGVAWLAVAVPKPAAAVTAGLTLVLYVGVYTPLKVVTHWNTLVGAVPGALPPVIGWCAARGFDGMGAVALFAILFVWQVPHFLAIAWLYRADYARARMRMLSVRDAGGRRTARSMIGWCAALLPVSLAPAAVGLTGPVYPAAALALGAWFLARTLRFGRERTDVAARGVLRASLVYLPAVLAVLVMDGVLPRYLMGP
jgi:protoheme IX farnesyltransferase